MNINATTVRRFLVSTALAAVSIAGMATPAIATPIPKDPSVATARSHNKLYPVFATVTGRTSLNPAEYASALAALKVSAAWWGHQTNGVITFAVSDSTPSVSISRNAINYSAVEAAATGAGYNLDDPTQIPVIIFPRHISQYRPLPENGVGYSAKRLGITND